MNSPWRDRPITESLKLFEDMRQGVIEEGKATLRMKQDMQSDNFNMYDLIAYRIKASLHIFNDSKLMEVSNYDYLVTFISAVYSTSTCWGQVVYLSKLWLCSLHCGFSWEYYSFGMLYFFAFHCRWECIGTCLWYSFLIKFIGDLHLLQKLVIFFKFIRNNILYSLSNNYKD